MNYDVYALFHGTPPPLPRATSLVMLKVFTYLFQLFEQISTPEIYFKHFSEGMEDSVGLTLEDLEV